MFQVPLDYPGFPDPRGTGMTGLAFLAVGYRMTRHLSSENEKMERVVKFGANDHEMVQSSENGCKKTEWRTLETSLKPGRDIAY